MRKLFSSHNLPFTLMVLGLSLDVVDKATTKAGTTGGLFFGPAGFLRGVNAMLPTWYIPGTKNLGGAQYPAGLPIDLGGWVALTGLALYLLRLLKK